MNESATRTASAAPAPPTPAYSPPPRVSEIFDPARWREIAGFAHGTGAPAGLTDVTYHRGCVRDADGAWISDLPVKDSKSRPAEALDLQIVNLDIV